MDDSFVRTNTGMMPYMVAASQVLGVTSLALTGAWLAQYRGGFTWAGPEQFNVHPLCTVLGMVFLFGDAMLVFRVFRHETKKSTKILHSVLNILALIITVVGMIAVFQYHNKTQAPHLFSLHGWLGMMTFVLFMLQWVVSFIVFFLPGVSPAIKGFFKPLHVFIGISLLASAIATCLLGFTEKILFSIPNDYYNLPPEGILVNVLGMVLVAYGLVITYILIRDDWKRPPLPEEQALSIDFKTLTQGESPTEP